MRACMRHACGRMWSSSSSAVACLLARVQVRHGSADRIVSIYAAKLACVTLGVCQNLPAQGFSAAACRAQAQCLSELITPSHELTATSELAVLWAMTLLKVLAHAGVLQAQDLPKHLAAHPQSTAQLTPWQAVQQVPELPADKAAAISAEMQDLVDTALQHGAAGDDVRNALGRTEGQAQSEVSRQVDGLPRARPACGHRNTATVEAHAAGPRNAADLRSRHGSVDACTSTKGSQLAQHQQSADGASAHGRHAATCEEGTFGATARPKEGAASACKGKPRWALSEAEAAKQEAQEESELLDFADGLDFDAFVHELEDRDLQAAIEVCAITAAIAFLVLASPVVGARLRQAASSASSITSLPCHSCCSVSWFMSSSAPRSAHLMQHEGLHSTSTVALCCMMLLRAGMAGD